MNQVNPFYIISLSVIIIIFLFYKNSQLEDELMESINSFQKTKKVAIELKQYKEVFKKTKNSFRREIGSKYWIRENNIKLNYKKNGVEISAKKLNLNILNRLMSKILNGVCKINSFNIETKDNKTTSVEMSLKW